MHADHLHYNPRCSLSFPATVVAARVVTRARGGAGASCQQVEEVLDPSLRGKPVGIKQKYLMVTCNYAARRLGVRKMESVIEVSKGRFRRQQCLP